MISRQNLYPTMHDDSLFCFLVIGASAKEIFYSKVRMDGRKDAIQRVLHMSTKVKDANHVRIAEP